MNRTVISPESPAHPANTDHGISLGGRKVERVWDSLFPLSNDCREELILQCQGSPEEICGLITDKMEIFYIANIHEFPRENFYFDLGEFKIAAADIIGNGERIIGMFHTHPTGIPWPSPRDIVGWPNPALGWRYWIATRADVIEWALR